MTIYNYQTQRLPSGKAFDANGKELTGGKEHIFRIDTVTGEYKFHKRDANGEFIIEHDDVAVGYGRAIPPITIKWSKNKILHRVKIAWYVFELKVSCWWRTGNWPKRNKPKGFIKD